MKFKTFERRFWLLWRILIQFRFIEWTKSSHSKQMPFIESQFGVKYSLVIEEIINFTLVNSMKRSTGENKRDQIGEKKRKEKQSVETEASLKWHIAQVKWPLLPNPQVPWHSSSAAVKFSPHIFIVIFRSTANWRSGKRIFFLLSSKRIQICMCLWASNHNNTRCLRFQTHLFGLIIRQLPQSNFSFDFARMSSE